MAGSNKCWRQRWFEPSQEWCFKEDDKWQCVVGIEFIMICACVWSCKFYTKLHLASGFTLTKSTRTVTLQDLPLLKVTFGWPYAPAEVTILVREYQENYQKTQPQTSFSRELLIALPRNFAWQFRRSSPMTYIKTVFTLLAL